MEPRTPPASSTPRPTKQFAVFLAVLVGAAAGVVVLMAWATDFVACETAGSDACSRHPLAEAQLWLAVAGLVPAGLAVRAVLRGERTQAWVFSIATALAYGCWAILNDAAVHGWGEDMTLVP